MNKENILFHASDENEKLFLSKIFDKYNTAYLKNYNTYTNFLSLSEQALISKAFSGNPQISIEYYGGYKKAERKISAFLANPYADYPIKTLEIEVYDINKLCHRDFLGSLMSLGIEREMIGDITIGECAYVFVIDKISEYIIMNLDKIGGQKAKVSFYEGEEIAVKEEYKIIKTTVGSLRLDSFVSAAFNISRAKSAAYISSGNVSVNFAEKTKGDIKLSQGDIVSVRGYGRAQLDEISGITRKNRISVVIKIPL